MFFSKLMRYMPFPDEDVAVEGVEGVLGTAAVDGAVNVLLEADAVLTLPGLRDFLGFLGGRLERDVEIAVDLALLGLHLDGGLDVRRERHVDVAVHRAEGHGLIGRDPGHGDGHVPIHGVDDGVPRDVPQGVRAVDVLDLDLAADVLDDDIAVVR